MIPVCGAANLGYYSNLNVQSDALCKALSYVSCEIHVFEYMSKLFFRSIFFPC